MQWFAQAPSNIALIKYMGKEDIETNTPINSSLSYTLHQLLSTVTLEECPGKKDHWKPLDIPGATPFTLSQAAQERFLNHLSRLKAGVNYTGGFIVRSNNNFPISSGLASSASSFAALTRCALKAISELTHTPLPSIETEAQLSRLGSGSSCRSFFSPWALWTKDSVKAIDLPYQDLIHQVIVISHAEKKVSSSEAHLRIQTSPHYPARAKHAEDNLKILLNNLKAQEWSSAYHICWQEFQALHQLFSTCATPFSYMTEKSDEVLKKLQALWESEADGPIITMDAGPNIHLLYRPDQADMAFKFKQDVLLGQYDVL